MQAQGKRQRLTAATYVISVMTVIHTMGMYSVLKRILAVCHFLIQVAAYLYITMCSWMQLVSSHLIRGIKISAVC